MLRKSLQTITWGDPQHHLFDHIFGLAVRSGFEGVEIGFRRLSQIDFNEALKLLNKHRVSLCASHIGGNLADLVQSADERGALDEVLQYLVALDCKYLIYSGLNVRDEEQLATEINLLRETAKRCAESDIGLLYHNHDWEFRNDRLIWRRLQDAAISELGFAPDLGWAVKGGQDMGALLDEIGSSVEVLHFKDFVSWEDGQNTCHLGSGVIDFAPAWSWLSGQGHRKIWVTAEQDNAEENDVACELNGSYLSSQIAKLPS